MSATFRTCPSTGLKVHSQADALIKANAVVATVALLVGGIAALLVLLTRWQAVHLLDASLFYRMLTVHGMNMLIFFILFFEMAVLYFASAVLLNSRVPMPSLGWVAFGLMVLGTLLVEWTMWTGRADVLFTSYVPLRAHPAFYLGVILFAVGAILVVSLFFATLVVARREKTHTGSVPLVTFGALTAAIIAAITLLHGAIIYIPTFLWSMGLMDINPQMYRLVWWGLGHSSQQINVAAMVSIWYLLGALTVGGVVLNEKVSRSAFVLYVLFISMASAHHLLVDPGMGPSWKVWNTSYFMYMAVLASMIHGFTVPAGIEIGQRLRGVTQGLFGWLSRAPWGDPGFSSLMFSLVIFGFVGGITGVTFGTEQINIIAHNTLRIPGHFHATVVSGTAMAFMGVTYYVIPLIFRREVAFFGMARLQPYFFALGMLIFSMAMTFAGTFGVPRRHADITFLGAPFRPEFSPAVDLVLGVMALGGIIAIVGGAMYIVITVWSVFFGRKLAPDEAGLGSGRRGLPPGLVRPPRPLVEADAANLQPRGWLGVAPGTMILVLVFLLAFVTYYFVNWKLLSFVWKVG
ncbi:MAG: cbb3-type cytochrome c oxidase subunit I [Gemmatimonadota bacterium]